MYNSGNQSSSPSTSDSSDDFESTGQNEWKEDAKDNKQDESEELPIVEEASVTSDMSFLFNSTELRKAISKVKEKINTNVLQQHSNYIVKWLEEQEARMQEMFSLHHLVDLLVAKDVARQEAVKALQQFVVDDAANCDISALLATMRLLEKGNSPGDLSHNIRILQSCPLVPGFVDVYSGNRGNIKQHGQKIMQFLLTNRASTSQLPVNVLNGFNNTSRMRLTIVEDVLRKLSEKATMDFEDSHCSPEEGKRISRCYNRIEVSTNSSDVARLVDNNPSSYWQSDGAARSHWIRLYMKKDVILKHLSIGVASYDFSYMPQHVTIAVGKNSTSLHDLKDFQIASTTAGEVVLLENLKSYYPVIQININRCYSNGCDTRVHSLKTIGYRVTKEKSMSVRDASHIWYLQVMSSTAMAVLPTAPALRSTLLQHTMSALGYMQPLSLSHDSSERPSTLTQHVLTEVDQFITNLAIDGEKNVSPEGLLSLLSFSIARGHVTSILTALKCAIENGELAVECTNLMEQLTTVRNKFWERHGGQLQLSVAGCDGGQSDNNTKPENVLTDWDAKKTEVYTSKDGKTLVNMFFECPGYLQLTKIRIKVASGGQGPRRGFVFVYKDMPSPFKLEDHLEKMQLYDKWGAMEYKFSVEVRAAGIGGKPDNPVSYFTLEDDLDEVDVPVNWYPVGKYVLIKFLEARKPDAKKISISGIKFYGFQRDEDFIENNELVQTLASPIKSPSLKGEEIVLRTLSFLVDLIRDQAHITLSSTTLHGLTLGEKLLDSLWHMYSQLIKLDAKWQPCSVLVLQLLHSLCPFLSRKRTDDQSSQSLCTSTSLLEYLCAVVDCPDKDTTDKLLVRMARKLLVDGAAIFFPDKDSRKKYLFLMMSNIGLSGVSASVTLLFQSLCQFFSAIDPSGLLELPATLTKDFDPEPVLIVMENLNAVCSQEFQVALTKLDQTDQQNYLTDLVSSLQTSLLSWCHGQLIDCQTYSDGHSRESVQPVIYLIIVKYATLHLAKTIECCHLIAENTSETLVEFLGKLERSFLSSVTRQLLLALTSLGPSMDSPTRVTLLRILQPIVTEFSTLVCKIPAIFPRIDDDYWSQSEANDVVLQTWEVESSHNYENNQHAMQVFSCPGATSFQVIFDPRCETERRFDYLVFTDARGNRRRFDWKVGTDKWPSQVTFTGGHSLQFLFHSDSSNNEWGYMFKAIAKGAPDSPLFWLFDLDLGLAKLCGCLCGLTLDARNFVLSDPLQTVVEDRSTEDRELLRSDLWTTLFRGGYMTGKLQRSLSGKYSAEDSSDANYFLWKILDKKGVPAFKLLNKCRAECHKSSSTTTIAGLESTSDAIAAVFAALLWHTQPIREEITKLGRSCADQDDDFEPSCSDGMVQAYIAADTLRLYLLAQRQKLKTVAEDAGKTLAEEEDPVEICRKKALFLMKFAGLSKIQLKQEQLRLRTSKFYSKKHGQKKIKADNEKHIKPSVDSDVDPIGTEKYPAFKLVLEFVKDAAWTTDKVDQLLRDRAKHAQSVADVYMYSAEFLRIMSNNSALQIENVLFLQELLEHQDRFGSHYAEGLEGCGLESESRIRRSYYTLVRRLVDAIQGTDRQKIHKNLKGAYDFFQSSLLHLLDVRWQDYDLSFVADIKLPELYFDIAKETVKMRDRTIGEQEENKELEEYEQCIRWFKECSKKGFSAWYKLNVEDNEDKKNLQEVQMFVAKFSDLLDVEISCDGCDITLPARRYRCLQCTDIDLCATCYGGGVKPCQEHTDDHELVYLMYKCNKCQSFIVGTRIHCEVCEDFDLCLGCQINGHYPSCHATDHEVTKYPIVKLKNCRSDSDSLLQAYIHQHVWLQFSALALSLIDFVFHEEDDVDNDDVDQDYQQVAAQLHHQCIDIAMECLEKVPDESASTRPSLGKDSENLAEQQEETFALHSQERIMGLLGAVVPPEHKKMDNDAMYNFGTEKFLRLLLQIAKGDSGHEVNTQHLAIGLLGLLLTRTSSLVVDEAVKHVAKPPASEDSVIANPGHRTIEYLFLFGATCLERSGLEWACSLAGILQKLNQSEEWNPIMREHLSAAVQNLNVSRELSSIFALFVIAGFPEVLTIGSPVRYEFLGHEMKEGVVLKHYPDKHQTLIIDMNTRKRHTVEDCYIDSSVLSLAVMESGHLDVFRSVIYAIGDKVNKGETMTVEETWILSLALKALSKSLLNKPVEKHLWQCDFLRVVADMAKRGTGFPNSWQLKDLELLILLHTIVKAIVEPAGQNAQASIWKTVPKEDILSLMLYTHKASMPDKPDLMIGTEPNSPAKSAESATASSVEAQVEPLLPLVEALKKSFAVKKKVTLKANDVENDKAKGENDNEEETHDDDDNDDFDSDPFAYSSSYDSGPSSSAEEAKIALEGLSADTRSYFQTLHELVSVPYSVLRTLYDMSGHKTSSLIWALQENWEGEKKDLPEEIKALAKKWMSREKTATADVSRILDAGIYSYCITKEPRLPLQQALEEIPELPLKLIPTSEKAKDEKLRMLNKTKSATLLKEELEKHGKSGSRDFLLTVNLAMTVLHCRSILAHILSDWSSIGHVITPQLLGCKDIQHLPCLLDLFSHRGDTDMFKKIIQNVIQHLDPEYVVSMAKVSCDLMESVAQQTVTCQSEHPCKSNVKLEDKVMCPGAAALCVLLDKRCCMEKDGSELVLSGSADYTESPCTISGGLEKLSVITVPGDTMYYKFTPGSSASSWGYRFTLYDNGQVGFSTGYIILRELLQTKPAHLLPMNDLWPGLVYMACKLTYPPRLKAIHLMLMLMQTQTKSKLGDVKLQIDLSLLRPLWLVYCEADQAATHKEDAIVSSVQRALTELFLYAENIALEHNIAKQYLVSLEPLSVFIKRIMIGLSHVAAVSHKLGLNNLATSFMNERSTAATSDAGPKAGNT